MPKEKDTRLVYAENGFIIFSTEAQASIGGCLYEPGNPVYSQKLKSISIPVNNVQAILEDNKYTNLLIHPGNGTRVFVECKIVTSQVIRKAYKQAKEQVE
mmetsp:Transcript_7831/g.11622  ORF Transcript_7831/g.11622 Transcript_7831/m.11622 type:complete len:100 (+) Transcript_7831:26-325(+)